MHEITINQSTYKSFRRVVNMTAKEIAAWLETAESKSVGQIRPGEKESIGRQSARKIIAILGKKKSELTAADYAHMRKVYSYVRRHGAQEPRNIETSRWRYSLMNWGHDPVKAMLGGRSTPHPLVQNSRPLPQGER